MRRVALCLGVDRYEDDDINNLSCAGNDAAKLAFTLLHCGFDEALALTQAVSAEDVMARMDRLGKSLSQADLFVFFFAGHGKTFRNQAGEDDQLFLLPAAKERLLVQNLLVGGGLLSWRTLKAVTAAWQGVQSLFILDACRMPLSRAELATRDRSITAKFEGGSVFRDVQMRLAKGRTLETGAEYTVINSCGDGQQAEELPKYPNGGHGLLTAAVIEELRVAAGAGQALVTDAVFGERLHARMQGLVGKYGSGKLAQQPMLVGKPVPLLVARREPNAAARDGALWRLAQAKAKTQGIAAYEEYIRNASDGAAHLDEALTLIDAWHDEQAKAKAHAEAARQAAERAQREAAEQARVSQVREEAQVQAKRQTEARARREDEEAPAANSRAAKERAEYLRPGRQFKEAWWAPKMVVIPAGRFVMGSPVSEYQNSKIEWPQHEVHITQPFAMGRCVVTFDAYDRFAKATGRERPSDEGWGRGGMPAINVSWYDAQAYIEWLNGELGLKAAAPKYRLPTEAEWEYSARAGRKWAFWWGDKLDPSKANFYPSYAYTGGAKGKERQRTVNADAFEANPWGLHQVHGNVEEWVQDGWHDDYKDAPQDGSEWKAGTGEAERVLRGGSWKSGPSFMRAASRSRSTPDYRSGGIGFRIARTL